MRAGLFLLVLLLAGCGSPGAKGPADPEAAGRVEAPTSYDHLTDRLAPGSATFQDYAFVEDAIDLPGNGSIELRTGLGVLCHGDADGVAPNRTGWVACMMRLASDPAALSQDVHDLGIGPDTQRLTLRQPSEPVEWRVAVTLADGSVPFDSGWRPVDLSPVLDDPVVTVEVHDPCDAPDAVEASDAGNPRGLAVLVIEGVAAHGKPFVEVDLARSRPMLAESTPFADHATFDHAFAAYFPTFAGPRAYRLELPVDLEAPESPATVPGGPCVAPMGGESQEWPIDVGITGADGAVEYKSRSVRVNVVLDAAAR